MFATVHSETVAKPIRGGMRSCNVCNAIYRNDFKLCPTDGGELSLVSADPLVGKTICEHYVIDALIGEGAMGRVYRAHHVRLVHKRYAVKVLLGDLAASPAMRIRFQHEAEAASRLDHPGIVGVVDFGRTRAGLMYIVMELIEGPSLRRLVRETAMTPERTIGIARKLAEGLAHAHSRGVVHRDLKPDNVLVVGDAPRIADFGLAISVTSEDARLTTSGIFCTPLYAAPEQLLGKDVDHRADLYALGATMFEMLTGFPPFRGEANQVMAKKLSGAAPRVATHVPNLPPALAALVDRLLARKASGRPSSATEVVESLEAAMIRAPARRLWRRWAFGAVAFAAITGGTQVSRATQGEAGPTVEVSPAGEEIARTVEHVTANDPAPPIEIGPPRVEHGRIAHHVAHDPIAIPMALTKAPERATPRVAPHARIALAPAIAKRRAAPQIVALDVIGSLSTTIVRRAIERVLPALHGCASRIGPRVVIASFAIGETRRATALHFGDGGSQCLASAFSSVRTEVVPDVGDAVVQVKVLF